MTKSFFCFRMRAVAFALFLVAVILYSWNSDDAYHSYIMAKHLVEGKGLVYNTGCRVTASTHPLLTLLEAFVFLFTDSADICGLLLGLLFSGAAAWILFFRFRPLPAIVFCLLGLIVSSRCFLSYTSSGLENPMLFFFGALFLDIYFRNDILSKRHLFALALLMSLLAVTRTDSVLLFVPMAVWAYLRRTDVPFFRRIPIGIAGLLPFFVWTAFSILYYGFPFPNTYYAKLHTGIPLSEHVVHGLWYHVTSWAIDPLLLLVPGLFAALAIKARSREMVPLFVGLAIYELYVVSIGGDFMAGRHLTQQFFLSVCGIALLLDRNEDAANVTTSSRLSILSSRSVDYILAGLCAVGFLWNGVIAPIVNERFANVSIAVSTKRSAVDERHFYLSEGNEEPLLQSVFRHLKEVPREKVRDPFRVHLILSGFEKGARGVCFANIVMYGRDVFACSELDMYLADAIALQDPLLARLKVNTSRRWRIGHAMREIPAGYQESLASGDNRIENPYLHEYYEKLLLVMKAPLFDRERMRTILDLNRGRFDDLLEQYEKAPRPMDDLERAFYALNVEKDANHALELLDTCLIRGYPTEMVFFCRGCVFEDLENDSEKAEKEYEKALRGGWDASMVPCADRLARLKAIRGERDDAIALWEKASTLAPNNMSVLWNLAVAYHAAGNIEKVEEAKKRMEKLSGK